MARKRECGQEDCTEAFYSQEAMDLHVLREHPLREVFDG